MKDQLKQKITEALNNLGIDAASFSLDRPDNADHGDYSTNVALATAKQAGKNPRALAEEIVAELENNKGDLISKIEIAGPGFINFFFAENAFETLVVDALKNEQFGANELFVGKKVMVEYTQPNPFKPFHIGHLMSNAIGEAISRVVEFSGATVVRANYQGDVGLHVAKSIWQIQKKNGDYKTRFANDPSKAAEWIGQCYSEGSNAYDSDESIKAEIDALNKIIYEKTDAEVNAIYDWGRAVTLEAFEIIYAKLGTKFDQYFFESEMANIGSKVVHENTPNVFEESDGAIVFKAENYDPKLHTRVFISSKGLPMYEAKEIGLTMTKFEKYNPDLSIMTTAIEQGEYMKVVRKAIEQINPSFAERMTHITHGMMKLATGKMSSRKGNVITGESLIADSIESVGEIMAAREHKEDVSHADIEKIGIGALKYSILKQEIGGDIIYDPETSISFDGDAGPYLQYMVVRIESIKRKAESVGVTLSEKRNAGAVTPLERELLYFTDIVHRAANDLVHITSRSMRLVFHVHLVHFTNQQKSPIQKIQKVAIVWRWWKLQGRCSVNVWNCLE